MIESREIRAACPGGRIVFLNRVSLAASFLKHLIGAFGLCRILSG
jgi:hypothetical protein